MADGASMASDCQTFRCAAPPHHKLALGIGEDEFMSLQVLRPAFSVWELVLVIHYQSDKYDLNLQASEEASGARICTVAKVQDLLFSR